MKHSKTLILCDCTGTIRLKLVTPAGTAEEVHNAIIDFLKSYRVREMAYVSSSITIMPRLCDTGLQQPGPEPAAPVLYDMPEVKTIIADVCNLTGPQVNAVIGYLKGWSRAETARYYNTTVECLKKHLSRVYSMLGVNTRWEMLQAVKARLRKVPALQMYAGHI